MDRHPVDTVPHYAAAMVDSAPADCLFCRIVAGEVPADVVRAGERTLAFRDIAPQAPVHVLVVTRQHYRDAAELAAADPALAGALVADATAVALALGLAGAGYRIVLNTGAEAGQTVFHVHAHVLGGRGFSWPPG
jgi:histidine triad (HIT) family protein